MTIGVGLIGYGLGGRAFHAPYVNATPGMTLRAIVSRQADKILADHPQVQVVDSVSHLLEQPGIDLVIISSPDALHGDHALAALAAGKHVVVDKPFATRMEDAQAIARLARAKGLVATAFQNRRWDADFLTLRRILNDGMLGEIVQFESHFDRWRPQPADNWKDAREGGSWMDLGPHLVDQAIALFGLPIGITADIAALRPGAPAPDYFHAVLRYPTMRAILHASKSVADHGLRFAVHGRGGSLIKHGTDPQEAQALAGAVPGAKESWGLDPIEGVYVSCDALTDRQSLANERGDYLAFWRQVVAAIATGVPNPVPADDAVAVMQLLHAGLESAARRCEIIITPLSAS